MLTKVILPTTEDFNIKPITFDMHCSCLDIKLENRKHVVQLIPNMKDICVKIVPYVLYYQEPVDSYNKTVHCILPMKIPMILSNFNNHKWVETVIETSFIVSFTGWAYARISGYLHIKRQIALQAVFGARERNVDLTRNENNYLETSKFMHDI